MTSVAAGALGAAWGVLLATPLVRRARRVAATERASSLEASSVPDRARGLRQQVARRLAPRVPAVLARPLGEVHRRRALRSLDRTVDTQLPVTLDLLAVAVGAGCTPYLAVGVAARWAPPMLATQLAEVVRSCALGRSFADALDDLAVRIPPLQQLSDALLVSERFGAAVGDALVRLAVEQRAVLRRRAETRARTVPVRLLFPLVFLVLPAFGLLTVVPAVLAGFGRS